MILDEIVRKRQIQLAREMDSVPLEEVRKQAENKNLPMHRFSAALKTARLSVIAEVKKASPSKGLICPDFHPVEIAKAYKAAGANAISVLTEDVYFKGNLLYLQEIRKSVNLPILRKDFIIDPYQIYEARAAGADAILLIAALLDTDKLKKFADTAHSLGLDCLTEVHSIEELSSALEAGSNIIGINNRNLKTFEVTLQTTENLVALIPPGHTIVSESGIRAHDDMKLVRSCGADAVLIGETLMRSGNVAETLHTLRDGL